MKDDIPKGKVISAARMQFIASVRIAATHFDQMRSPTECMREIKRALHVLDKVTGKANEP